MAPTSYTDASIDLNHLRRGLTYRATTSTGVVLGEYLGIETPHGDWSILLRGRLGVQSIGLDTLTSVQRAA
jgi:hypothetical protein